MLLKSNCKISLAPLQGITDYHFRNLYNSHFKGIDEFYTPFLRLDKKKALKTSQVKDIQPENNKEIKVIPQILTNSVDDFIFLSKYLFNLGYPEINWNLGCPFPMVAKRQLGSGLLPYSEKIDSILNQIIEIIPTKLSIKMRLGYENESEIDKVLPLLDKYPLTEIIIHTRIGKQMYKGNANPNEFEKYINLSKHQLSYNGDIDSLEKFNQLNNRFNDVNKWMIGRSAISNPFLIEEIKNKAKCNNLLKLERFAAFHNDLYEQFLSSLSGSGHVLSKMTHFWEYFSQSFSNSRKVFKAIKKSNSISKFEENIHSILHNEDWIA